MKLTEIHHHLTFAWKVISGAVNKFISEDTLTQSAGIAFYMIFSLAPMLLVIFWAAGLWYEESLVREAVFDEFGSIIGQQSADELMNILRKISETKPTVWATIKGVGALLFTATTVFVTMKHSLNKIFQVTLGKSVKQGLIRFVLDRLLSVAMLCVLAIILTMSMILSTLISAFSDNLHEWSEDPNFWLWIFDDVVVSFISLAILFAFTYRYMPDTRIKWRDAWFGGFTTATLFIVGQSLIGSFLGQSQYANYYDAAGGLMILMLWVYYFSAIFLFGATIIHFRAKLIEK